MASKSNRDKQIKDSYKQMTNVIKEAMDSLKDAVKELSAEFSNFSSIFTKDFYESFKNSTEIGYKNFESDFKEYVSIMKEFVTKTGDKFNDLMGKVTEVNDNVKISVESNKANNVPNGELDFGGEGNSSKLLGFIKTIAALIGLTSILSSLDNTIDTILEADNRLQRVGMGSDTLVHDYRDSVAGIVKELNAETGGKYSLKDAYNDIATLTENTDIARVDTLKEITRPALLAYKSMNVSLDSIAQLTGGLYEYAGIDSLKTEGLLNYVKNISTGMNVNEQEIVDAMLVLEDSVTALALKNGLSDDAIIQINEGIASMVTQLESSGIESSELVGLLDSYLKNPYDENTNRTLTGLGINTENLTEKLLTPGGIQEVQDQYVKSLHNMYETMDSSAGAYAESLGVSIEQLQQAYTAIESGVYDQNKNKIEENAESDNTMVESVEDQYISLLDQISNNMSETVNLLTDIKDKLGIGFMDIIGAFGIISGAKSLFTFGKDILSGGGSGGGLGGGGLGGGILGKGKTLLSNAKSWFKNLFGKGASSADDTANWADDFVKWATSGADDMAKAATSVTDDIAKAATSVTDDVGKLVASTSDDVGKLVVSTGDDVAKVAGAGSKALGAVAAAAGFVLDGVFGLFNTEEWFGEDSGIQEAISSTVGGILGGSGGGWFDKEDSLGTKALDTIGNTAKWAGGGAAIGSVVPILGTGIGAAVGGGIGLLTSIIGGENISKGMNTGLDWITGLFDGSHEDGLWRVPEDGYKAILHKDEAVLTKEDADDWRLNSTYDNYDLETLRSQSQTNSVYNEENMDKLLNAINTLIGKVDTIIGTFNEYTETQVKMHNDNKLEATVNNVRTTAYGRLYGVTPSADKGGVFI